MVTDVDSINDNSCSSISSRWELSLGMLFNINSKLSVMLRNMLDKKMVKNQLVTPQKAVEVRRQVISTIINR